MFWNAASMVGRNGAWLSVGQMNVSQRCPPTTPFWILVGFGSGPVQPMASSAPSMVGVSGRTKTKSGSTHATMSRSVPTSRNQAATPKGLLMTWDSSSLNFSTKCSMCCSGSPSVAWRCLMLSSRSFDAQPETICVMGPRCPTRCAEKNSNSACQRLYGLQSTVKMMCTLLESASKASWAEALRSEVRLAACNAQTSSPESAADASNKNRPARAIIVIETALDMVAIRARAPGSERGIRNRGFIALKS
mmetsp:Transcript_87659/g.245360  ORF Transcript_87659/g.245360 Transcript_87659/m.245360 type:complete len:248 (-) Transcript_87659:2-745(-)